MYEVGKTIQQLYLNSELWALRELIWVQEFETIMRCSRPGPLLEDYWVEFGLDGVMTHLKERSRIENAPFSKEEMSAWKRFEKLLKVSRSFWMFSDEDDFNKLLYDLRQSDNAMEN